MAVESDEHTSEWSSHKSKKELEAEETESEESFSESTSDESEKVSHEKEKAKKEGFEEERKLMEKRVSKAVVQQSKYDSLQGGRQFDEKHTKKGKRESEAASLTYDSPGDDEQSDPGHGSRDQEEHDI